MRMASVCHSNVPGPAQITVDENISGESPIRQRRKRASRACLSCRIRKVRCDVAVNGVPCLNCKDDLQPCILPTRSRKRRLTDIVTAQTLDPIHGLNNELREGVQLMPPPANQNLPGCDIATNTTSRATYQMMNSEMSLESLDEHPYRTENGSVNPRLSHCEPIPPAGSVWDAVTTAEADLQTPFVAREAFVSDLTRAGAAEPPDQHNFKSQLLFTSYPFLDAEWIQTMSIENFDYLNRLGCLQLPEPTTLNHFLRAYFLYVHPHLPLIDEGRFWGTYHNDPSDGQSTLRLSLFVFRAMLLAACSFVPLPTLRVLGFESVRSARTAYFCCAKALFDFEIDKTCLPKAQGSLLMTYHVPINEPHLNTHWLGMAIHYAKVEGADRYHFLDIADTARNTLKRLWWCCIIRDRLLNLGVRRPLSIHSGAFEKLWPMLEVDDLKDEIERSKVYNAFAKRKLLESLIDLCKLCVVLTDVLLLVYPCDGLHATENHLDLLQRTYFLTLELNKWYDRTRTNTQILHQSDKDINAIVLLTNLVRVYFHSAKAALCNYRIMLTINESTQHSFERLQAKHELQCAMRGIANGLGAIFEAGMINFSPISMTAFVALPSIWYNLETGRPAINLSPESNQIPNKNLYHHFMEVLRMRYEGSDRAFNNMSRLMRNLTLEDPASPSSPTRQCEPGHSTGKSDDLTRLHPEHTAGQNYAGVDIILSHPQKYVRIIQILDFLLSRGRFPTANDIPKYFPTIERRTTGLIVSNLSDSIALRYAEEANRAHKVRSELYSVPNSSDRNGRVDASGVSTASTHTMNGVGSPSQAEEVESAPPAFDGSITTQACVDLNTFSSDECRYYVDFSDLERLQSMLHTYPGGYDEPRPRQ